MKSRLVMGFVQNEGRTRTFSERHRDSDATTAKLW